MFYTALQPLLTPKAAEIVFANIEDLLMFNTVRSWLLLTQWKEADGGGVHHAGLLE